MRDILGNGVRNGLIGIAVAMLPAAAAVAEPPGNLKLDLPASSDKLLPLKSPRTGNDCAALGPGFVKIEGTDTCINVGGAISVGTGGSVRSR
jgi:hypothetical protein